MGLPGSGLQEFRGLRFRISGFRVSGFRAF